MSNYADYFGKLASSSDKDNNIDFGSVVNHKSNRAKRNYLYTHPNQLRSMTTHHNKKISHSKQNDLLGAIELLAYKPPPILPISEYTKQTKIYGSGKKKPFVISETENLNKKTKPVIPKTPVIPKPPVKKDDGGLAERQRVMDKQLSDMEKQGLVAMRPTFSRGQNFMNNINYPKSKEINTKVGDNPKVATY